MENNESIENRIKFMKGKFLKIIIYSCHWYCSLSDNLFLVPLVTFRYDLHGLEWDVKQLGDHFQKSNRFIKMENTFDSSSKSSFLQDLFDRWTLLALRCSFLCGLCTYFCCIFYDPNKKSHCLLLAYFIYFNSIFKQV